MNNYPQTTTYKLQPTPIQRGSILVFSVIILTVITSITFAVLGIFIPKIKIASDPLKSTIAFYAADSGAEQCIYKIRKTPSDLLGFWRFDEGVGTITNDSSGNGNLGRLINGSIWDVGRYGNAINFDGTDDRVDVVNYGTPVMPVGGLVAHLEFDESSGTSAADSSGQGNNGTLINGAAFTSGYLNNAVNFDGLNDMVTLPNMDVSGTGLTLSAWIKADAFTNDPRIISKALGSPEEDHYWMLSTTSDGQEKFRFRLKTNGVTSTLVASPALSINNWYHVVATYDGSNMRLYLNGYEVAILAKTGTINTNPAVPVSIGANPQGYGFFDGLIDDVQVYNRALSPTEIQDLSGITNFDIPGPDITLAAWFKADDFGNSEARLISKALGSAEHDHYFMLSTINSGGTKLRFRVKTGLITTTLIASTGTLSPNIWYHAAATYDGANMRLYLNGVQVEITPKTGALATSSSVPVSIGANPSNNEQFDGIIDEVRVYNRALSGPEIQELYSPSGSSIMNNGASYSIYYPSSGSIPSNCDEAIINHRVVGTYQDVARSLEVY